MNEVPDPSDRYATLMSVVGSATEGFSFTIAGSFQFRTLPMKIAARSGASNFTSVNTPGRL